MLYMSPTFEYVFVPFAKKIQKTAKVRISRFVAFFCPEKEATDSPAASVRLFTTSPVSE